MTFQFFCKYREPLKISTCLQMALLFVSSLILDEGITFMYMLIACAAYWLSLLLVMVRRNGHASGLDVFLLKWGYPLAIPVTFVVAAVVPLGILRR